MTTSTRFRSTLFKSFWLAGFESACQILRSGERLDMLRATQHDRFVDEDYGQLPPRGIATIRDTIRWHLVEPTPGHFDFSSVAPYVRAAERHDIQVVWDLLHYGWPEDVDLFSPDFPVRLARFARATASYLREASAAVPFYTPINELSFFAWAAGEIGMFHPCARGRGTEVKRQLVRGWIAAVDAIRDIDPRARFVSVDPLINSVPPIGDVDSNGHAAVQRASQWVAWDMISGRREPELGGRPDYLDIIGLNFYYDNQWEEPGGARLDWRRHSRDPRWLPLSTLLRDAYARYQRPLLIGETSHIGVGRGEWIRELTEEVCLAVGSGVPLEGICLYPIIDRFEWDNPSHWHNSGLWDVVHEPDGTLRRVVNQPYANELRRCQARLAAIGLGAIPTQTTVSSLSGRLASELG